MNKYWPETNTKDAEKEEQLGCKMLHLSNNRMSSMKESSLMAWKNDLADGKKSVPPLFLNFLD